MKINEKNLSYFATSPPVDFEGYLQKRGEVNKSWQRRYFVLKGNLLFYFDKKAEREPIGVIILEGCTIELAEEGEQYCFQIVFHGINNRTYYLSAESQETMERWMKALTCAGYEYMKLMVAELQRQLTEIEQSKDSTNRSVSSAPKPPPRRQNPFNRPANEFIRPAPPIPANSNSNNSKTQASNGNGINSMPTSLPSLKSQQAHSNQTTLMGQSNDSATNSQPTEFTFQVVHEAFGREIMQDLHERKRLKELCQRPLIEL